MKRLQIQKKYLLYRSKKKKKITEQKLRKVLEKYGEVKSMRVRQDKHGRKGNTGMACFATQDQAKLTIKMLNKIKQ